MSGEMADNRRASAVKQKRRQTLMLTLQLQALGMQHSASKRSRRESVRQRRAVKSNAGNQILSQVSDSNPTDALLHDHSEQLLPAIGAGRYKYAGGEHWFQNLKGKAGTFLNCKRQISDSVLPDDVEPFTGTEADLPDEILRLEVYRRDDERKSVAEKVNKAIEMLMDKLANDEFAQTVLSDESNKSGAHLRQGNEEDRRKLITESMFSHFDNDHSDNIDFSEFEDGVKNLAKDMRRLARISQKLESGQVSSPESPFAAFDSLSSSTLETMFNNIAGSDKILQMDEFVAFYRGTGSLANCDDEDAIHAARTVWTLMHESESLMLDQGTFDELLAERSLVQRTFTAMRDRATLSYRDKRPAYTNAPVPYDIMPTSYISQLAQQEAAIVESEAECRRRLSRVEADTYDALAGAQPEAGNQEAFPDMEESSSEGEDAFGEDQVLAKRGPFKSRVPSGLRKRDKIKLTLMWIFVVLDVALILAVLGLVLVYEETQTNAAITAPEWLAWDISPGAFTGCRSLPPQLYGSFGPTQVYVWDPATQSDLYPKVCPEGLPINGTCSIGTTARPWTIDEVIGTPNGATILKWSPDGYNAGLSSVECATAWGTWDLNYGWENGIIYNFTAREFVYFGHIWKRSLGPVDYLEFWEVSASDLTYHIDELRSAIEGFWPEYDGPSIDHWTAPAFTTEQYPKRGIPLPPSHRWCWNYEDCDQLLVSTEEVDRMWEEGTIGATFSNLAQPDVAHTAKCDDSYSTDCDPDFGSSPVQTVYS